MAKAIAIEDSDVEMEDQPKTKKQATEAQEEGDDPQENSSEGEDEEGEPVDEYEIEAILGHKYNMAQFGGRIGYLVKWKGYPDSENSYVDENDAKGAQDLIDAYWKRNKKGPKPKGRKSAVSPREESEEVETSQPPPKKRGRPPKAKTPETPSEEEAEEERPKAKKPKAAPRKSTEAAKRRKSQPTVEEEENGLDEELGNMKKWLDAASWEHLVDTIDTVERTKDNELYVYFTLNNKSAKKSGFRRCREKSAICKEKMPMKLLDFYESNLRWREDTDEP